MNKPIQSRFSSQFALPLQALSSNLGAIAAAIGLAVILGWLLNIQLLKSILPILPNMRVSSAFCLLLLGSALTLCHQNTNPKKPTHAAIAFIVFSLSSVTVFIAALSLLEAELTTAHFDWATQLWAFFLKPLTQGSPSSALLAPMPVNAALCFLLTGGALLLLNIGSAPVKLTQFTPIIVWLLSFLGLLEHFYSSIYFYVNGPYSGMAVHTAIALQLLSIGILYQHPDRGLMSLLTGSGAGSTMARRLLPITIFLPPILGGFCALGYHWQLYGEEMGIALSSTLDVLLFSGLIGWNARKLNLLDA